MSEAAQELAHLVDALADPARECQRVAGVLADEARRARDAVRDDVRAEAAGQLDRLRAALHRRGQPALGVRERDDDLLVGAAGLDDLAVVGQRVLAERDLELRDRDRDRRDAGDRLGDVRVRLEVDARPFSPSASRRAAIEAGSFLRGRRSAMPPFWRNLTSMPAQLIDGKVLAAKVREEVAAEVAELGEVGLTTVLVGDDPASHVYINGKHKAATSVGIHANDLRLPADLPRTSCSQLLAELNADDAVDGILVQLPLPKHIDETRAIEAIDPGKDVDGFHPVNAGRLYLGRPNLVPGTPLGIMRMLAEYRIEIEGRARRRRRALEHRRQADGAPAAPGERDRDDLPLAHRRPRSGTRSTPTSSSPPSGSCT